MNPWDYDNAVINDIVCLLLILGLIGGDLLAEFDYQIII
jgi:hypothetical protein